MYYRDTIAAISTPVGEGGIGIVRLSGDQAIPIAERIFTSPTGKKLQERPHKTLVYGYACSPKTPIPLDEVLVSVMRAPHTYTAEDVVEINVHSGNLILRQVLQAALDAGARLAERGEFTKRAFLNGRIDLAQAEAVIDLIRSPAPTALRLAERQLEGLLSRKVKEMRGKLVEIAAHLEAGIDFVDEDVEVLPYPQLLALANSVGKELSELLLHAESGKIYREGVPTSIIGKPNVGKSSLLNLLLKEDRAIVTSIPGTTRDIIEEKVVVKGICLKLQDTAGLRHPRDEVEEIGIRLTHSSLRNAQLILFVIDLSQTISAEDEAIMGMLEETGREKTLVVLNKSDLSPVIKVEKAKKKIASFPCVVISARTGRGISELEDKIEEIVFGGLPPSPKETMVTNVRHIKLLKEAKNEMDEIARLLGRGASEELASTVLKNCLDCLGEITGETASTEILDKIFCQFCLGK